MIDKSVLIYFKVPVEISDYLESLYKRVNQRFPSKYNSSLNGKSWESHLMLYLSSFPENNLPMLTERLTIICNRVASFNISLTELVCDEYGFIYFKLDSKATQLVEDLRNELVKEFKDLRNSEIKSKYLEKWDTFSAMEKTRLKDTGLPYPYIPHLTIARVNIQDTKEALKVAKTMTKDTPSIFKADTIAINTKDLLENDENAQDIYLIKLI